MGLGCQCRYGEYQNTSSEFVCVRQCVNWSLSCADSKKKWFWVCVSFYSTAFEFAGGAEVTIWTRWRYPVDIDETGLVRFGNSYEWVQDKINWFFSMIKMMIQFHAINHIFQWLTMFSNVILFFIKRELWLKYGFWQWWLILMQLTDGVPYKAIRNCWTFSHFFNNHKLYAFY